MSEQKTLSKATKVLVLYHKNCLDGYAAAYAAWKFFGDEETEYHAIQYGDPLPINTYDVDVFMVDFSLKRGEILNLLETARSITIIDHHKSAEKELSGLDLPGLTIKFDMNKSGAVLSHEYFHHKKEPHELFYIIQDRDLWLYKNCHTKAITNYLWAVHDEFEHDFRRFEEIMENYYINPDDLIIPGTLLEEDRRRRIDATKKNALEVQAIPIVNCPHGIHSEVIGELSIDHPFAVGFYYNNDKIIINLRSDRKTKDSVDVSIIATENGGGGHKNAAGFTIPLDSYISVIFKHIAELVIKS